MKLASEARKVAVVFGEVGVRDPLFHLTSECPEIPAEGAVAIRWEDARARVMIPRFCEACGPLSSM